jgi:hypothetical protein
MMKRIAGIAILALGLSACGGGGEVGESADVTTTQPDTAGTTKAASSPDASEPAEDDGDEGAGSGGVEAHSATVTIGGETYTFGDTGFAAQQCKPDLFGVFFAVLYMIDDEGNPDIERGVVNFTLLRDGVDSEQVEQWPELTVSIADLDLEWIADERGALELGIEAGMSQVDSYTVEGNRASGTATFYESNSYWAMVGGQADELETAQGSFEVVCADS